MRTPSQWPRSCALTAINYAGIKKSALLTRVIVAVVLAVLAAVVVIVLGFGDVDASRLAFGDDGSVAGVLQAAGLLFFAFAGYARIATLGEEVRDPARTIPRAIPIALGITLAVYAIVAVGGAWRSWAAPAWRHRALRWPTPCGRRASRASNRWSVPGPRSRRWGRCCR